MEIQKIGNAHWLESGAIDCDVLFEGMNAPVPYTATANDTAATGQQIWQELQSGKWGDIAPFETTAEMLEAAKADKRREIEVWRVKQEARPFTVEWNGHTWNAGSDSLARLAPVTMAAKVSGVRATLGWGDATNNLVPLTLAQLQELASVMAQAQMERNEQIYQRQREMKDRLDDLIELEKIRSFMVEN